MRHIALGGALLALVPATPCWAISGLTIGDPQLLHDIERSGFSFGELVVGAAAAAADNAALYRQASYRGIVANLAADLESLRATDRLLGTTIKARHRLLDARWLMSSSARFELVGVVNAWTARRSLPEHVARSASSIGSRIARMSRPAASIRACR